MTKYFKAAVWTPYIIKSPEEIQVFVDQEGYRV